jgi:hypothetical protein
LRNITEYKTKKYIDEMKILDLDDPPDGN